MGYQAFSPEWVAAFETELQASDSYKAAGRGWEGAVALQIIADPALGLPEDTYILMDLHDGVCRSVKSAASGEAEKAPFIIAGPAAVWRQVLEKKLGPVKGMMTGRLKLRKGSLGVITRYLKATQCIVDAAVAVGADFPE